MEKIPHVFASLSGTHTGQANLSIMTAESVTSGGTFPMFTPLPSFVVVSDRVVEKNSSLPVISLCCPVVIVVDSVRDESYFKNSSMMTHKSVFDI